MSKKKSIVKGLIIIFSIIVVLLVIAYFFINNQDVKIQKLEQQTEYLKEEIVPMKFEIIKNDNSEIKLKSVFYNLNGDKAGSKTVELKGDELNFDFKVINLYNEDFLFFPYGIYTDKMAAAESIKIFESYDKDGFPAIYEGITKLENKDNKILSKESENEINEGLSRKFYKIKMEKDDFSANIHGVALHNIKSISKFKKGFVYKIVCHPHTGAIEIIRE